MFWLEIGILRPKEWSINHLLCRKKSELGIPNLPNHRSFYGTITDLKNATEVSTELTPTHNCLLEPLKIWFFAGNLYLSWSLRQKGLKLEWLDSDPSPELHILQEFAPRAAERRENSNMQEFSCTTLYNRIGSALELDPLMV